MPTYPSDVTIRFLMDIEEELLESFSYCKDHEGGMLSVALNCDKCIKLTGKVLSANVAFSLTEIIMRDLMADMDSDR